MLAAVPMGILAAVKNEVAGYAGYNAFITIGDHPFVIASLLIYFSPITELASTSASQLEGPILPVIVIALGDIP